MFVADVVLGIEQIQLRGTTRHKEKNDAFDAWREVQCLCTRRTRRGANHVVQSNSAEATSDVL